MITGAHLAESMREKKNSFPGVSLAVGNFSSFPRVVLPIFQASFESFEEWRFGGGSNAFIKKNGIVGVSVLNLGFMRHSGFVLDKSQEKKFFVARVGILEDVPFGDQVGEGFLN